MRLFVLLALLAAPALADEPPDRPPAMPARDVAVDEVLQITNASGAHPPTSVHVSFSAASHRMRVAAEGRSDYMILDPQHRRLIMVSTERRAWQEQPFRPAAHAMFLLADSFSFAPAGQSHVAGLPCTTWDMRSATVAGTTCVTADGVIMRVDAADNDGDGDDFTLRLVARSVSFARQSARDFEPPADFRQMQVTP